MGAGQVRSRIELTQLCLRGDHGRIVESLPGTAIGITGNEKHVTAYSVELSPAAVRQLRKLDGAARRRLQAAIELLAENPRPSGAKKLVDGGGVWRVRTGDYRVIYEINDGILLVLVLSAGHRRDIYSRR